MKNSVALLVIICVACSTTQSPIRSPGAVARKDSSTLLVTYYGEGNMPATTFVVPSDHRNYEAYLDMVGGDVAIGNRKEIPCSIGRVTMIETGDLIYNIAPGPARPDAIEPVKRGSERYRVLMQKYPDLTPGHFRLIRC